MNKLVINTKNLIQNVKAIKRTLNGRLFCAVVKADAYSHGIENIVPFIDEYVDYYAVANITEGVALREITNKKILVLGSFNDGEIELAVASNLELSIYSDWALKQVLNANKRLKVHIKVNTGMNRLGFLQGKIKKVLRQINESNLVEVVGVYSHIYDNKSKADILSQKAVFDRCTKLLKGNVVTHLAATAGIDFVTDYKMARVGLGIYGYPKGLPVMSIESNICQKHFIKKGDKVGYDGCYVAEGNECIATVPLGYYDGLPLNLRNGGSVIINNKKCPIVGKVCMDMFMCKVPKDTKVGDKVIVFYNAKHWAKIKGTNAWEVLTSIKRNRLKVEFR